MNGFKVLTVARKKDGPALLNCEAEVSCGAWVKHEFAERREIVSDNEPGSLLVMYRCTLCGHKRRWGVECVESDETKAKRSHHAIA